MQYKSYRDEIDGNEIRQENLILSVTKTFRVEESALQIKIAKSFQKKGYTAKIKHQKS